MSPCLRQAYIRAQRDPKLVRRVERALVERLQVRFGLPEVVATDIARRLAWG